MFISILLCIPSDDLDGDLVYAIEETAPAAALFFAALTVTLLGYSNPARRIAGAVRGLLRRPRRSASRRPLAVVGHRGAPREAAENTLVSFAKAVDPGADAIETDVCVTRDGRFVL